MNSPEQKRNCLPGYRDVIGLALLSVAGVLIHGYHLGVEDQAIYVPAILKHFDPRLFPHDSVFFEVQTKPTLFDELVAGLSKFSHVPWEWVVFLLHLLSILLLLLAGWRVAKRCFDDSRAVWAGLGLLTGLLLIPVAGTAQYIVDQYLHPRALATALILMPVADLLPGECRKRGLRLAGWIALWFFPALVLHLQIAVLGLGLLVFLTIPWEQWFSALGTATFALVPLTAILHLLEPGTPAWQEAARTRSQHYLLRWEWYEWLGIIAPMIIFWFWGQLAEKRAMRTLAWFCRRMALYGTFALLLGMILSIPPRLERLTTTQPLRTFIFVYVFLLLLGGGILGQLVLKKVAWRWFVLFVPIAVGMYASDRALFSASPHIEWPGSAPRNDWAAACLWIRANTPLDAYFALNPHYFQGAHEDNRGFRAWARRSSLSDYEKDAAVASLVPSVADRWQREVHARDRWDQFAPADFERLKRDFGTDWALVERQLPDGKPRQMSENLECPYLNETLAVCKIR